jgi:hypothetical protein
MLKMFLSETPHFFKVMLCFELDSVVGDFNDKISIIEFCDFKL